MKSQRVLASLPLALLVAACAAPMPAPPSASTSPPASAVAPAALALLDTAPTRCGDEPLAGPYGDLGVHDPSVVGGRVFTYDGQPAVFGEQLPAEGHLIVKELDLVVLPPGQNVLPGMQGETSDLRNGHAKPVLLEKFHNLAMNGQKLQLRFDGRDLEGRLLPPGDYEVGVVYTLHRPAKCGGDPTASGGTDEPPAVSLLTTLRIP